MFNKSKKYGIIKGLPFVCLANINGMEATENVKSTDGQILLVVDDETFTLKKDIEIFKDKTTATLELDTILGSKEYKKDDDTFNIEPLDSKKLNEHYKIVSYKIKDSEEKTGESVETDLRGIKFDNLKDESLTIKVESLYKLEEGSLLTDGSNNIPIKEKVFLFSDLKGINDLNTLKNVIEKNCKDAESGDGKGEGKKDFLNLKIEDDKLGNFYVSKYQIKDGVKDVADGNLINDNIKAIIEEIKTNKKLILTFSPYVKYVFTEGNFDLSGDLKKIRKLKVSTEFLNELNDKTNKLTKKNKKSEILVLMKACTCVGSNIAIDVEHDNVIENVDGGLKLEITADPEGKLSEVMKGTIKFQIEDGKPIQYDSFDGKDIDVTFGEEIKKGDGGYTKIDTTINQTAFKKEIAKYLGGIDAAGDKYSIDFTSNFGTSDTDTATDGFVVTITFKGIVPGFTKEKDKNTVNINIKLDIYDNVSGNFQLQDGLQQEYKSQAFDKKLDYNGFITALETILKKDTGTLAGAIKEVTYNNGTDNVKWESTKGKTIEELVIKEVTVTLSQQDNGTYVKKKASEIPPKNDTVKFKLGVTTSVNGYKVKAGNETLDVEVAKAGLDYSKLFSAIQTQIGDNKFKIKKGNKIIGASDTISTEQSDLTAYSIELTAGSKFLEAVKNDDKKDEKNEQNGGDKGKQNGGNKENKGCCGGKCSGPKDKK